MHFKGYPMVHRMTDPNDSPLVAPEQFFETVTFASRTERGERVGSLFRPSNVVRHVPVEPQTDVLPSLTRGPRRPENLAKSSMIAACLIVGLAVLGGCDHPADCSGGEFRGGCVPGAGGPPPPRPPAVSAPAASPPVASPPVASPTAVSPPLGRATPSANRGDPGDFADVDDKQCRSYGLKFGTRDYADCRIRLSAQHRGLDPNLGAATPGSGSR
jgi:hypothetical protein